MVLQYYSVQWVSITLLDGNGIGIELGWDGRLDDWTTGRLDRWTAGPLDRWTGNAYTLQLIVPVPME